MATFLKDWRNPALVIFVIGTILFGTLWLGARKPTTAAITVGDTIITDQDIVNTLKARFGNQVVADMVTNELLKAYAASQNVSVSKGDIDQLVHFQSNQLDLAGSNLDDFLKNRGITMDEFRKELAAQALQVKLAVKPDEMKAAVDKLQKMDQFNLPTRYRFHMFTYSDKVMADEAVAHLKQGAEGVGEAAKDSMNPGEANRVLFYVPGVMPKDPVLTKMLSGLAAGQCSQPTKIGKQGNVEVYGVVQVVEVLPAEHPTYENSNIIAGQLLIRTDAKKYGDRLAEVEAAALGNIDYDFITSEYALARESFKQKELHNPQIPGMPTPNLGAGTPAKKKSGQ